MARQADIDQANDEKNKLSKEDKGMTWDRSCTDVLCCLIFVVFLVVMVGVSFLGFTQGDPKLIVTPFDSVGNRCGAPNQGVEIFGSVINEATVNTTDYTPFPFKFFSNIRGVNKLEAVCVSACPKQLEIALCMPNS